MSRPSTKQIYAAITPLIKSAHAAGFQCHVMWAAQECQILLWNGVPSIYTLYETPTPLDRTFWTNGFSPGNAERREDFYRDYTLDDIIHSIVVETRLDTFKSHLTFKP